MTTAAPTHLHHEFRFADPRPPHVLAILLESRMRTLFATRNVEGQLELHSDFKSPNSLPFQVALRFERADARNVYRLTIHTDWSESAPVNHEYCRKSSQGWCDFWTRDLQRHDEIPAPDNSPRYREMAATAVAALAPRTVAELQAEVMAAVRAGKRLSQSHKEGDTRFVCSYGQLARIDEGDNQGHQTFADDAAFLAAVENYFGWQLTRGNPEAGQQFVWSLIARMVRG